MTIAARKEIVLERARDMAVLVSPVRQEIFGAIGLHGPITVADLARHLGRAQTSLYHHLTQLQRIGVVEVAQVQRADGRHERTFAATVGRVRLGASTTAAAVRARQAAGNATLRLAARELAAALADPSLRRTGPTREVVAMRGKAWLDATQLRRLDRHVRAIESLLRETAAKRGKARAYSLCVVLAPTDGTGRRSK